MILFALYIKSSCVNKSYYDSCKSPYRVNKFLWWTTEGAKFLGAKINTLYLVPRAPPTTLVCPIYIGSQAVYELVINT